MMGSTSARSRIAGAAFPTRTTCRITCSACTRRRSSSATAAPPSKLSVRADTCKISRGAHGCTIGQWLDRCQIPFCSIFLFGLRFLNVQCLRKSTSLEWFFFCSLISRRAEAAHQREAERKTVRVQKVQRTVQRSRDVE